MSAKKKTDVATMAAKDAITVLVEALEKKAYSFLEEAAKVTEIKTDADRHLLAALKVTNTALQKEVHADLDPLCSEAHGHWQNLTKLRKKHLDPLQEEAERIDAIIAEDFRRQQRIAAEKQAKLQVKADARAQDARDKEVAALEEGGQHELAVQLASAPVQAPAVVVGNKAAQVAAAAGLTFRVERHMQITDVLLLERKHLQPDMDAIKRDGAALWDRLKPADPNDAAAFLAASARFAASEEVRGVRFWVTKEPVGTGRR